MRNFNPSSENPDFIWIKWENSSSHSLDFLAGNSGVFLGIWRLEFPGNNPWKCRTNPRIDPKGRGWRNFSHIPGIFLGLEFKALGAPNSRGSVENRDILFMENWDIPSMENRDSPSMDIWDSPSMDIWNSPSVGFWDSPSVGFCPLGETQREDEEKSEPPKIGNFRSGLEQPVSAGVPNKSLWEFWEFPLGFSGCRG